MATVEHENAMTTVRVSSKGAADVRQQSPLSEVTVRPGVLEQPMAFKAFSVMA
jgi:hypothetical protein